jgi:hypothetical protein
MYLEYLDVNNKTRVNDPKCMPLFSFYDDHGAELFFTMIRHLPITVLQDFFPAGEIYVSLFSVPLDITIGEAMYMVEEGKIKILLERGALSGQLSRVIPPECIK